MVKQQDLQDLVKAVNDVLAGLDKRISALEEAATKRSPAKRAEKSVKST